ncbi:hypothetical protein [Actinomadura formosensis]|uniref:hypothetical protein n=1 Tax=Actinomadura formosensis TaxID=60706 RepID=UPI000AFA7094|nr:hypothetical protein [Actinomadura formosensis]
MVPTPAAKRRGPLRTGPALIVVVVVVLIGLAVGAAAWLHSGRSLDDSDPCCRLPPDTSAIRDVPRRWQTALAQGDVRAAWDLLTPQAQRRYGSADGLRAALPRLTMHPEGPATWRQVAETTQGRGTPSAFFYLLVEDRTLRPVGAVVAHSVADGSHDGRIAPEVAATMQILSPASRATVGTRPRIHVATDSPPTYVAVQAGRQAVGAVGAIRGTDGFDAPFPDPGTAVRPGPTLIVAVAKDNGRFSYGSVLVTVR